MRTYEMRTYEMRRCDVRTCAVLTYEVRAGPQSAKRWGVLWGD